MLCFHRCLLIGGIPHGLWSQVPSWVSGPRSFLGDILWSLVPGPRSLPWSLVRRPFWEGCHCSCPKSCYRFGLGGTPVLVGVRCIFLDNVYPIWLATWSESFTDQCIEYQFIFEQPNVNKTSMERRKSGGPPDVVFHVNTWNLSIIFSFLVYIGAVSVLHWTRVG